MGLKFGRYETLRAIAVGGMAKVYLGRALGAGGFERLVAIKVMHPHFAADPEFVTMFLDEARLAARIRHPNVVATQDVVQGPEGVLIVMDWVDGPPLSTVLKALVAAGERFPLDVALRIFLDVLSGLQAAHDLLGPGGEPLGLVHRDVSPQNVLIGKDGVSRLTDFGVAHAGSRLTTTRGRQVKGKLAYLAPEQISLGNIDRRGDVYAAGVVLWEMFTGKRLFRGNNDGATIAKIIAGHVESPRSFNPDLPEPIEAAILRALETDADRRFQTAAEFADALEGAATSLGVSISLPRSVAAFITAIGAEELAEAQRELLQSVPPGPASDDAPIIPPLGALPAGFDVPPNSSTNLDAAVTHRPPSKSRRTALVVAGGGALVLAVATALLLQRGSSSPTPSEQAAAGSAPAQPVANVEAPAPSAEAVPRAPIAAPTTSAPSAVASAVDKPPRRSPAALPLPAVAAPKKPPSSSTSYRPSEL